MRPLAWLAVLLFAARAVAADGVTPFRIGLQAFQANGADALLGAWYDTKDDTERIAGIREHLNRITRGLGPVIDTEVFQPYNLGRHVQRQYGVIYFQKRPLWITAEYYEIAGRGGFISLDFSLVPADVLPLTLASPN